MPFKPGQSGNPEQIFTSTHQPNNPGRPKKLISSINEELKKKGYDVASPSNIIDAYQTLINLPMSEVAAIAYKNIYKEVKKYPDDPDNKEKIIIFLEEGDNYPILYRIVAKELLDNKRGGEFLEKLLDRAYGKAKQNISAEIENKPPVWFDNQPVITTINTQESE